MPDANSFLDEIEDMESEKEREFRKLMDEMKRRRDEVDPRGAAVDPSLLPSKKLPDVTDVPFRAWDRASSDQPGVCSMRRNAR